MPHLLPSAAGFDIVRLFAPETWVQSSPRLRAGQAEWEKGEVPEGRKTCFPRTQVCGGHNLSCPKASGAGTVPTGRVDRPRAGFQVGV